MEKENMNLDLNLPRAKVIDVPVSVVTMEMALSYAAQNFESLRGNYICAANAYTAVIAHENDQFLEVIKQSAITLPDGKPLAVVSKKVSKFPVEKVSGPCFMRNVLTDSRFCGKKHFFYGTTSKDIEEMIQKIRIDYPELQICGYEPSVFRDLSSKEIEELADRINHAEADFVWVALGTPLQEQLMHRMQGMTNSIMIGVGGAFHMFAGRISPAPKWMQDAGFEWLYRLYKEPKRLFKRYLINNAKFIYYLIKAK